MSMVYYLQEIKKMNLDEFKIAWFPVGILFICLFNAILSITISNKKHSNNFVKIILTLNGVFSIFVLFYCLWITHYINYTNSGYSNIAKITLHTCTKDNKTIEQDCEYIGAITYRPHMRELMITTTPLYPILNCPSPNNGCVQERIFVDKGNVKGITVLE